MSVQTTYSIDHAQALKGMVADLQLCNGVSKVNKTASVIPYGTGVVTHGDNGAQPPSAASTDKEFIGVVRYELNRAQKDGDVAGMIPNYDGTVVTHGVIWVTALDAVTKDADVYLRVGATGLGDFSGIAGTGVTLGALISGAKFLNSAGAGELVKISLGLGG